MLRASAMVAGAIGIGLVGVSLGFVGAAGSAIELTVFVYVAGLEALPLQLTG
jgi:hypothetical protein